MRNHLVEFSQVSCAGAHFFALVIGGLRGGFAGAVPAPVSVGSMSVLRRSES